MPATYTKDNVTSEMYILYKNKIFAPPHCAIEWNMSTGMNETLYDMLLVHHLRFQTMHLIV